MEKNGKNGTFFWKERMPNPEKTRIFYEYRNQDMVQVLSNGLELSFITIELEHITSTFTKIWGKFWVAA